MPPVVELQDHASFLEMLDTPGTTVIVYFYATWCKPCKLIAPYFEDLAELFGDDQLVFARVDVDNNEDTTQFAGITSLPTFQVYRGRQKLDEVKGSDNAELTKMVRVYSSKNIMES